MAVRLRAWLEPGADRSNPTTRRLFWDACEEIARLNAAAQKSTRELRAAKARLAALEGLKPPSLKGGLRAEAYVDGYRSCLGAVWAAIEQGEDVE
ncbi:hypothetical protein [Streptomyces globosus]|uniref:hypothetical protein n=1 Tax=Streptomyces globosus TaxID=68209 RepID=UPI003645AD8C